MQWTWRLAPPAMVLVRAAWCRHAPQTGLFWVAFEILPYQPLGGAAAPTPLALAERGGLVQLHRMRLRLLFRPWSVRCCAAPERNGPARSQHDMNRPLRRALHGTNSRPRSEWFRSRRARPPPIPLLFQIGSFRL